MFSNLLIVSILAKSPRFLYRLDEIRQELKIVNVETAIVILKRDDGTQTIFFMSSCLVDC